MMIEAYCNAFRNYANFSGRTSRKDFWYFILVHALAAIGILIVDVGFLTGGLLYGLYVLAGLIPTMAAYSRRLHDTGRSGWMWLWSTTGIGAIPVLIWFAQQGTPGPNKYGPDPNRGYGPIPVQPGYPAGLAGQAGVTGVACIAGSFLGQVYPIGENEIVFGRDISARIRFPDHEPGVSRVHCKLFKGSGGRLMLMDCGSKYGTYLSGTGRLSPQQPAAVQKGTVFYLGSKKVGFRLQ